MDDVINFIERTSNLIIALVGVFSTVLAWIFGRRKEVVGERKIEVEITDVAVGQLFRLVDQLQEQLVDVHKRTDEERAVREKEVIDLRLEISQLRAKSLEQDDVISELRMANRALELRSRNFEYGVSVLVAQVRKLNLEPAWEPQEK